MGIDHGCTNVFVTEQFLYRANIIATLNQVGSEGVAQGMTATRFINSGITDCLFKRFLEDGSVDMMAVSICGARINARKIRGWHWDIFWPGQRVDKPHRTHFFYLFRAGI